MDFMGHLLTAQDLKPDPQKVEAILKLPTPKSKEDIERLNGMVNYLAKFLPRLSHIMEPLRRLTQTGVEWHWSLSCNDLPSARNVELSSQLSEDETESPSFEMRIN